MDCLAWYGDGQCPRHDCTTKAPVRSTHCTTDRCTAQLPRTSPRCASCLPPPPATISRHSPTPCGGKNTRWIFRNSMPSSPPRAAGNSDYRSQTIFAAVFQCVVRVALNGRIHTRCSRVGRNRNRLPAHDQPEIRTLCFMVSVSARWHAYPGNLLLQAKAPLGRHGAACAGT